ncbi:DUF2357 domain-containing protein [Butyrivibrio sp. VCD2006]|uniref:DUF2357 domain-containing protein n=1 Tax=Butyrivibrio sp. VCD2006 TaxID=1280664 RepID=UPI0003F7331C|nr:DUF2357 domain-containing protein [Butyrivibrio sp. VCD2006]
MQIFVKNSIGMEKLPEENCKMDLLLYDNTLLIRLEDEESVKIASNYCEEEFIGSGQYAFPILFDKQNRCNITVWHNSDYFKYSFILQNTISLDEEDIINLFKFKEQMKEAFDAGKEYPVEALYDAIKDNRVPLIIEKTPYAGYDDHSLLKKIAEVVPMVMDICSHPKKSLKSEEAVLDVNIVKGINSRTMDHLASHSEHWKARTLNGLVPNRLRTDVYEDEINIYENLFFRIAVDDVLRYVHRQVVSLEKTIQQNDNAIDWNAYGETLSDYKRVRIFEQLLPDYDVVEKTEENGTLKDLLGQWQKLERSFSTVEASKFYRSIDKKKRISRNIQPTNILKKDSRYNALYRLWGEIQRQIVQIHQDDKGVQESIDLSYNNCYQMYITVLLLYVFKLLEYNCDSGSKIKMSQGGILSVDASFSSETVICHLKTISEADSDERLYLEFIEKKSVEYLIPAKAVGKLDDIKAALPNGAMIDKSEKKIIFTSKPNATEQKKMKNLFHFSKSEEKGLTQQEKRLLDEVDKVWRIGLEELFSSNGFKEQRKESLRIVPQFARIENTEAAVDKFTQTALDSIKDRVVFMFPIDLVDYRKSIKSDKLISRLLNYGEKYCDEDAERWGDYKAGIIPAAQSEINSAQRLMKLVSMHSARLQIKWSSENIRCPICGSKGCQDEGKDNWMCNNPECGVFFGKTKHADGCGMSYEWVRPFVEIKRDDIRNMDYFDLMLKKEIIFDRLTITDFEFEEQPDHRIKYIPICPKCGKRIKH